MKKYLYLASLVGIVSFLAVLHHAQAAGRGGHLSVSVRVLATDPSERALDGWEYACQVDNECSSCDLSSARAVARANHGGYRVYEVSGRVDRCKNTQNVQSL